MGLLPAHQVDVAHGTAHVRRERGRPDETGGAIAQEVGHRDGREVVCRRKMFQPMGLAPKIDMQNKIHTSYLGD